MLQLQCKILKTFQNMMLGKPRMINCLNNFFYLFSYLYLFMYNIYIIYIYTHTQIHAIQCQYSLVIFFSCTTAISKNQKFDAKLHVQFQFTTVTKHVPCQLLTRARFHTLTSFHNFPRENVIRLLIYFSTREWFKKCVHALASVFMCVFCFFTF